MADLECASNAEQTLASPARFISIVMISATIITVSRIVIAIGFRAA